jgi:hypothetical protein
MSDESVILVDEDFIAAADAIADEIAPVFNKVRGKVPVVSAFLALVHLAKKVVENHLGMLKPEEKEILTAILCNFFDQTYLLLNPIRGEENECDGQRDSKA